MSTNTSQNDKTISGSLKGMKKFIKYCLIVFIYVFFITNNQSSSQIQKNKINSIKWENNSLVVDAVQKITYAESRLINPERMVIDILNCSPPGGWKDKRFESQLDEKIIVAELASNQIRIIFLGPASVNRKAFLINDEKTLTIRIARINIKAEENIVAENKQQTFIEKYKPGDIKEIAVEGDDQKTEVIISATKTIKYNTFLLKDPSRFVIDLLNIAPPTDVLPAYMSTSLVSGLRIGQAASGIESTRIVIDLTQEDTICNVGSALLGNKLTINIKSGAVEKRKEIKKLGFIVVIDPGHGGYDTGANHGGYKEKDINLTISSKLKESLEKFGLTVYLTREDDNFLSLAERTEITNSIKPNVFISVHANALATTKNIRGVETYYWTPQSQKLALYVHRNVLQYVQIPDHFIRKARFYVIRHTSSPAVLAELGFLTNYEDRKLLTKKDTQDQYVKALSEAILKFLDIELKPKEKSEAKKENE